MAIEYDGAFWHGDKAELDREKSLDLLAAGFAVMCARESVGFVGVKKLVDSIY